MKNLTAILFIILSQSVFAQNVDKYSVFNRLLIINSEDKIFTVKISGIDFWVTPGVYQNNLQSTNQVLDSVANTYGITISYIELKGVFILKRELNEKSSTSIRNVFVAKMSNGEIAIPKGIEEIKWVSLNEALALITFPHINIMIEKVVNNPEFVWGGTLLQFKEGDEFKSNTIEELYPLFGKKL